MITSTLTQPIITAAQEEELFGRLGLIRQALAVYNLHLSEVDKKQKYEKMAASPFSFYRGTAHLFWRDFAWDWRMTEFGNYRTITWINGDCHAYNFGAYQSHKGDVIYGLNDFDESVVADYQYDLWRLAISLVLIPNEAPAPAKKGKKPQEFPKVTIEKVLDALSESYLETLYKFADNRDADHTAYSTKNTKNPLKKFLKKVTNKESRSNMLAEWTCQVDGQLKFDRTNPDVGEISSETYAAILQEIPAYRATINSDINFTEGYFDVLDMVTRKNAGTGSLGSDRYYMLIKGDQTITDGQVILDIKEQQSPSAKPFGTAAQQAYFKQLYPNGGIRYVEAYRALDYHPDDHLGWFKVTNKYFGIRERNPFKKSFKTNKDIKSEKEYIAMAEQWGMILATEHSRANKVNDYALGNAVKVLAKGKKKAFKKVVREVAMGYAIVVHADFELFVNQIVPSIIK